MYLIWLVCKVLVYVVGVECDKVDYNCSLCKDVVSVILYVVEKVIWMVGEIIQILGGNGYINEFFVGCLWCDVKFYEIGVGIFEICCMLIGCELFNEIV